MNVRVWVGCLAHYNAGRLIGDWVDAGDAGDWQCPQRTVDCEETWCLDHEIPGVDDELSPMTAVAWSQALADVQEWEVEPFTVWLRVMGANDPAGIVERFRESCCGQWDSLESYAWEQLEEHKPDFEVPSGYRLEVDTVAWEQDHYYCADGYVFRTDI